MQLPAFYPIGHGKLYAISASGGNVPVRDLVPLQHRFDSCINLHKLAPRDAAVVLDQTCVFQRSLAWLRRWLQFRKMWSASKHKSQPLSHKLLSRAPAKCQTRNLVTITILVGKVNLQFLSHELIRLVFCCSPQEMEELYWHLQPVDHFGSPRERVDDCLPRGDRVTVE